MPSFLLVSENKEREGREDGGEGSGEGERRQKGKEAKNNSITLGLSQWSPIQVHKKIT